MVCRWLVLKAALKPKKAAKILTREVQNGALDVYQIITGQSRRQLRGSTRTFGRDLRVVYRAGRFLMWPYNARYEFDRDQAAALVAKLTKPKLPIGRPEEYEWDKLIAIARRLHAAGERRKLTAATRAEATRQRPPLAFPPARTFRKWLPEELKWRPPMRPK